MVPLPITDGLMDGYCEEQQQELIPQFSMEGRGKGKQMPHLLPAAASYLTTTWGTYLKVKPTHRELGRERKIGREPGPRDIL